jgi:L-arabinokinase
MASTPSNTPMSTKMASEILGRLGGPTPRFMALAPGRLDIIGGLTEYSGALVLGMPISRHVAVAVQRRNDGKVWIAGCGEDNGGGAVEIPYAKALSSNGSTTSATADGRAEALPNAALCVLGSLVEAGRSGLLPAASDGLSVSVGSCLDDVNGVGRHSAMSAATLAAASVALEKTPDAGAIAATCQRVENHWLDTPVGVADAACALLGECNTLLEVRCESGALCGSVRLPDDLLLAAVDSGVLHDDAAEKYRHVRTASYMGRFLIDRIIRHDNIKNVSWDGYLSQLSVTDFVSHFRDRLPTKIKGKEFLARFGETGDPLTRIDPQESYKIRSRTEHHIYEHARSRHFVECLARGIRCGDERAFAEAGEVMYASHWSYGQRCGLGCPQTDLLVNLIRRSKPETGIFGAKVTGRGCGGMVAVLLKRSEKGLAALDAAVADCNARSPRRARILPGSTPGALISGVQRV